jgi:hypothetical protein
MDGQSQLKRTQGVSKGGLIEISNSDGTTTRIPTFTCCHCGNVFQVPAKEADMGFCLKCFRRECIGCGTKLNGRCLPWERQIERIEKQAEQSARLRESIGGG